MDLSKAFDCLPHDLLIAKLHAYEIDYRSLDEAVETLILEIILAWFRNNSLVAIPKKFQALFPGTRNVNIVLASSSYISL